MPKSNNSTPRTNFQYPSDLELELVTLAEIAYQPSLLDEVELAPDHFSYPHYRHIFTAIRQLYLAHASVDIASISSWLSQRDLLNKVGGTESLTALTENRASLLDIHESFQALQQYHEKRQLIDLGRSIIEKAQKESSLPQEIRNELIAETQSWIVEADGERSHFWRPICDVQMESFTQRLRGMETGNDTGQGVYTHLLTQFDEQTGGLYPGDCVGVGGAPGSGKTAFAIQLTYSFAAQGIPVYFASLEMSEEQFWARMVACHTGIDSKEILRQVNQLSPENAAHIFEQYDYIRELPIYLSGSADFELELRKANRHFLEEGYGTTQVFFCDYFQLVLSHRNQLQGNNAIYASQFMDALGRELQAFTKRNRLRLILLLQVDANRLSQRQNKRPTQQDISYIKTLDQIFDLLLMLHRDRYWEEQAGTVPPLTAGEEDEVEILPKKNRHNAVNPFSVLATLSTCRFRDAEF